MEAVIMKPVAKTASILHAPISIVMRTGIPSQKLQYTRGTKQMDSGFVVGQPRARMLLHWPRQKRMDGLASLMIFIHLGTVRTVNGANFVAYGSRNSAYREHKWEYSNYCIECEHPACHNCKTKHAGKQKLRQDHPSIRGDIFCRRWYCGEATCEKSKDVDK